MLLVSGAMVGEAPEARRLKACLAGLSDDRSRQKTAHNADVIGMSYLALLAALKLTERPLFFDFSPAAEPHAG